MELAFEPPNDPGVMPVVEHECHALGRVQLKIVSNLFLEKDNK